jgi:hypothetical protein
MPNTKYTSQGLLAAGLAVAALSLTIMAQPSTARTQTRVDSESVSYRPAAPTRQGDEAGASTEWWRDLLQASRGYLPTRAKLPILPRCTR